MLGSKLLFTGSLLLPTLAPMGALSVHITSQSSIQYLWRNDPFQDATIVRRAVRIGRRRLERIRSVYRNGRLRQFTTTGKEEGNRRGHANGNTGETSDD